MKQIKRALIIIDVQNEYVTGNLPIEYPPVTQSLANIEQVIKTAKLANIPVVAFQHTAPETSPIFAKGSDGWQLHSVVTTQQPDKIMQKVKASCFAGTELKSWLEKHDVDTLTIIGYMTHNCDVSTAIVAEELGYNVEFIYDATGSLPYKNEAGKATAEEIHRTFTVVLQSSFAAVLTTADWLKNLASNKAAIRSNIFISNQQARLKTNK